MQVEHARDPAEQRDGGTVVARHERGQLGDAGGARVGDQLIAERRPDAALLVLVRDGECDLRSATVPYEPCDRDRPRVALDIRDVVAASTRASCASSGAVRWGFGPLNREWRDRFPSRSKTLSTASVPPLRRCLTSSLGPCFGLRILVCMVPYTCSHSVAATA